MNLIAELVEEICCISFCTQPDDRYNLILSSIYPKLFELNTDDRYNLSHVCKDICTLFDVLRPSIILTVGEGSLLRLRHTPCFDGARLKDRYPTLFSAASSPNISFSAAKNRDSSGLVLGWTINFRYLVPTTLIDNLIHDLEPLLLNSGPYSISWKWGANGYFSTRAFYRILIYRGVRDPQSPFLWQKSCPPACSMHSWLVEQKRLLTKDRLTAWGISVCPICVLCNNHNESHMHLFSECTFTAEGWTQFLRLINHSFFSLGYKPWRASPPGRSEERLQRFRLIMIWRQRIWHERNTQLFDNRSQSCSELAAEVASAFALPA